MKEAYEPANANRVDLIIIRSLRKNCAALKGTAALAAFLAIAATPAHAARHHHHLESSLNQSSNGCDETASSDSGARHHHHRRHSEIDQSASDNEPTHHHHHRSSEDDQDVASAPPVTHRHHHHHDDDADLTASAPVEHRHHHHHDEDADSSDAQPAVHHRHHHHSEDNDTAEQPAPVEHHHHHSAANDESASSSVDHSSRHESDDRTADVKRLMRDPAWLAHVARYDAHIANLNREHELRVAEYEAHEANVEAANDALHSGNVVRAAEAFRGTPYVMGGTSRSGFDCSGFTRYIFGESAGVELPRTAEEQYYTGQPVSKDDLRAGDLVFFRDTYREGISHVGMYIGDGRFVHACNPSKGVTVSSLSEQYYINHWAGARRVMSTRDSSDQ